MQALFETMDENLLQLREGEFSSALVCMRASPDETKELDAKALHLLKKSQRKKEKLAAGEPLLSTSTSSLLQMPSRSGCCSAPPSCSSSRSRTTSL